MNWKEIIGIVLFVLATAGVVLGIFGHRDTTIVEILARAPEKGNYSPAKVVVPVGEHVKLRIRNVDTVSHGFAIPDLGVDAGEVKAGTVAIVGFTPENVGSYNFYCTVWCSEHHLQMRGVLEVVRP